MVAACGCSPAAGGLLNLQAGSDRRSRQHVRMRAETAMLDGPYSSVHAGSAINLKFSNHKAIIMLWVMVSLHRHLKSVPVSGCL